MPRLATENGVLDRWAIGLSGLCLVHCLSVSVILALASSAGGVLLDPIVHEVGLVLAILFGIVAIGRGALKHGYLLPVAISSLGIGAMAGALSLPHGDMELLYTILGVGLLALGHDLNRRAFS
ncbi:MerC domain-containing protein [Parasphingopyxis lamellibrachiae]|uniref:MerC mercury resistance protein n=1 Tax=Parasphingopyxis lamellibrachiae TaxID=680125 RepID=A0A3D9FG78_9SPHN|nr:MerC domain-containing protein [Parasphingopyxis lamellibrachiae]RED16101.1 MerC mercury resistance protein [Parasphingopyxis lamellibrachiae]